MLEIVRRLWRKESEAVKLCASASVYADDTSVLLVRRKVWSAGPISLEDASRQRFALDDLSGMQMHLIDLLALPVQEVGGDLPRPLATKDYLKSMGVKSLRECVQRYRHVGVCLVDDVLVATPNRRDLKAKAWFPLESDIRQPLWKQDDLGARAVLDAVERAE